MRMPESQLRNLRKESDQSYQDLANAIIEVAVQDYRDGIKDYARIIYQLESVQIKLQELDCFFRSGYMDQLTDVNGASIRHRLVMEFKDLLAKDGCEPEDVREMTSYMLESLDSHRKLADNELRATRRRTEKVAEELNRVLERMEGK